MSEALFSKPIAVITLSASDAMTNGYLIVEKPTLITIEGEKYIKGRHAKSGANSSRGRNVLISLSHVTTNHAARGPAVWDRIDRGHRRCPAGAEAARGREQPARK